MVNQAARNLSPLRKSSGANSVIQLVEEQLEHFSIDSRSEMGVHLSEVVQKIYEANISMENLWDITVPALEGLDRKDRIAFFNAKRFLCFQIAKILDNLQKPMRKSYQSIVVGKLDYAAKGPYPLFDNITAIFSSNPVITRTATYLYACTEWIDDAFQGKEPLHEIYSRLMNPTSISLANHIVDIEAGPLAGEYLAWNFNSGMAAVDSTLSHLLGYRDIVLCSRNIYGGSYQLLEDWYGKKSNLDIAVEWFDGLDAGSFKKALDNVIDVFAYRLQKGKKIYVFLESPCNPHGYVLDVPGICRVAHENNLMVICDSTVGTPVLQSTLRRPEPSERPDFVIHSYTKDLTGTGTTTAGVVIGRNELMFLPKGESVEYQDSMNRKQSISWKDTLFWNVYYIKGAFLDSDKAFEVINGMRTLQMRVLKKCINTAVLAKVLDLHPDINVQCSILESNANFKTAKENMYLGLPAPLFTINFEGKKGSNFSTDVFKQFFDSLEPAFGFQVSLGQVNTVILCPALTSHSELDAEALKKSGITPTTIRIAMGDEDPRTLLAHFIQVAGLSLDNERKGFSDRFLPPGKIDELYFKTYLDVTERHIKAQPTMAEALR